MHVNVIAFERTGVGQEVGRARVQVDALVVWVSVRRTFGGGDLRIVLPPNVDAVDLGNARALEVATLRQLVARGDVEEAARDEDADDIPKHLRARRRSRAAP